jgi:hypothetical protein
MTPQQILAQLQVMETQLGEMYKAAENVALPQSVVMGFHWLQTDAGRMLEDVRNTLPKLGG